MIEFYLQLFDTHFFLVTARWSFNYSLKLTYLIVNRLGYLLFERRKRCFEIYLTVVQVLYCVLERFVLLSQPFVALDHFAYFQLS